MSAQKNSQSDAPKQEAKSLLHPFYVGKYDVTVQAANAKEAVALAEKQAKKKEEN